MEEEVIISPQIDEGTMQIDIESFTKDPDFVEDNDNEVKGELLDSIASEGDTAAASVEPYEGMEFESEEAARAFYSAYARHVGFRVRISRYTRSRRDNSIISRLIVCSKEGFREPRGGGCFVGERKQQRQRAVTRVGCKAMLMVKKLGDGKWVVSRFVKEHNHGPVPPRKLEAGAVRKEEDSAVVEEPDAALTEGGEVREPFEGMEFDSEEDARGFYINYARQMGFRARISKYCRSRRDNSIISRQIVCSKEGFRELRIKKEDADDGRVKRPRVVTRIGCKAMIVVKKVNTGKWVVSRFEKEHNHALETSKKEPLLLQSSSDDAAEKGLVTRVGGDDALCNGAVVMSGERCDGTLGTSRESLTVLYNRLCCEAIKFAQEGAVSEDIYNVAMSALNEAVEKVTAAKRSAAAVAQGVNGGHGSCITECSNEANKAVSGKNLMVMQQPVKFVLIPSTSLANDSKPANHSVESPLVLNIPNGQGISIPNPISVLKQSSPTSQSVKGLVGNGATEHMGAVQNSQKLDNIGVSQLKTTGGNSSSLASAGASEAQMVAFPALPVTVYMPVMGSLSESSSGGFKAVLTDQNKLVVAVGGVTALAAGIYTTREGARVVWGYVDRILGQPSLIRESSIGKYPWSGIFSRRAKSVLPKSKAISGNNNAAGQNGNGFGDVVLNPSLQKRIKQLAGATANTKAHQAPFRNMLFYGPPGTGKTMAARELAHKSGLDYALMTGGDVAPLGSQAVTKIHQLFDWAKKSNRGLLLFIDEADAFLCERNKTYMSEAQRSALNALLYRTGDQSKDIVLALATNRPGDLDSAVADRIDEALEFPLPGEDERFKMLKLYLDKYIAKAGEQKSGGWLKGLFRRQQQKIEIKNISDDLIREAAAKTDGFSGREIAKLMASVQAAVYGSKVCELNPDLFREVVDYKVAEHQQRRKLAAEGCA